MASFFLIPLLCDEQFSRKKTRRAAATAAHFIFGSNIPTRLARLSRAAPAFSKRYAGGEHLLYERGRRHEVLQLQVEDPLEPHDAERSEGGQSVQNPGEVLLLLLGVRVVGHVILERVDHLVLEILNPFRISQAVAFWKKNKKKELIITLL